MSTKSTASKIIKITTISLASLHIINRVYSKLATKDEILNTSKSYYYKWKHGKIHYTKTGHGSPILLIHDISPELSHYNWKNLIKKLSGNHTVYAIDLLGCGKSDKPNISYTQYLYVLQVKDFIEKVIGEKTDVITTGKSSDLLLLNANNPLINKKILINPYSFCNSEKKCCTNKFKAFVLETPIVGTFLYNMTFNSVSIKNKLMSQFFKKSNIKNQYVSAMNEAAHISAANAKYVYASLLKNYLFSNTVRLVSSNKDNLYILMGEYLPQKSCLKEYLDANDVYNNIIMKSKYHPELENVSELHKDIIYCINN